MGLNATSQSTVTSLFFKENRVSLFIERMMTNDNVTPVSIKEEQFVGRKTSQSIVILQIKQNGSLHRPNVLNFTNLYH
jgi:hypothetical protein